MFVSKRYFAPKLNSTKGFKSSKRQTAAYANTQWLKNAAALNIFFTLVESSVTPRLPTLAVIPSIASLITCLIEPIRR